MTWWCVKLTGEWTWKPRLYPGIWLVMLAFIIPYVRAATRAPNLYKTKNVACYLSGIAVLWIATDWPLGTLGAGYLASAHMLQFLLYTLGAAPLMLLGIPEQVARKYIGSGGLARFMERLAHPLIAGIIFNVLLLVTHAPITVDNLRSTQAGSFAIDLLWLISGLVFWMPIVGPISDWVRSYPTRMIYLFLAGGTIPLVPGGFLAFASHPLYRTYELAPRIYNISAIFDQQFVGALMKLGNIPVMWSVIAVMFYRWSRLDESARGAESRRQTIDLVDTTLTEDLHRT